MSVQPDPKQIVSALAEIARRRDMTHVVISPEVYAIYQKRLTKRHRAQGIGYTKAYNASIIIVPGVADHLVLSFSTQSRSQKVAKLLAAVRAEDWEEARTMMIELTQRQSRFVAISRLPHDED